MPDFAHSRQRWPAIARWAGIVAMAVAIVLMVRALPVAELFEPVERWVATLGPWGAAIFGGIYVLAALALVPGALLTLAAGPIFGMWIGTLVVMVAATTTAALAFLIGRYLARGAIEGRIAQSPKLRAVDRAIGAEGWKIVLLMRLSPLVPFNLQNYLYGATAIGFWPCMAATAIGMLPGTFLYVYLGTLGKDAASHDLGAAGWAVRVIGLAATIVVTIYLARLARHALSQRATELGADVESAPSASNLILPPPSMVRSTAFLVIALSLLALAIWANVETASFRAWIVSRLGL